MWNAWRLILVLSHIHNHAHAVTLGLLCLWIKYWAAPIFPPNSLQYLSFSNWHGQIGPLMGFSSCHCPTAVYSCPGQADCRVVGVWSPTLTSIESLSTWQYPLIHPTLFYTLTLFFLFKDIMQGHFSSATMLQTDNVQNGLPCAIVSSCRMCVIKLSRCGHAASNLHSHRPIMRPCAVTLHNEGLSHLHTAAQAQALYEFYLSVFHPPP